MDNFWRRQEEHYKSRSNRKGGINRKGRRGRKPLSSAEKGFICQMYEEGMSVKDIAKVINRKHASTIHKFLRQSGLVLGRHRESNFDADFIDAVVSAYRRLERLKKLKKSEKSEKKDEKSPAQCLIIGINSGVSGGGVSSVISSIAQELNTTNHKVRRALRARGIWINRSKNN